MSTSEIERLVTWALHADAEEAMNQTDTQDQLDHLLRNAKRDDRRRRLGWTAGTALVAAAAVVAALVWWPGQDDVDTRPVEPPDTLTPAEQVATEFAQAYADFDWPRYSSYLADDLTHNYPGRRDPKMLRRAMQYDEATSLELELDGCFQSAELANQTFEVGCLFTAHWMHSEEMGKGPFPDNSMILQVRDDQVVFVNHTVGVAKGDVSDEMVPPFIDWIDAEHPEDMAVLDVVGQYATIDNAAYQRSLDLWDQRVDEYAEAVIAGEAE